VRTKYLAAFTAFCYNPFRPADLPQVPPESASDKAQT